MFEVRKPNGEISILDMEGIKNYLIKELKAKGADSERIESLVSSVEKFENQNGFTTIFDGKVLIEANKIIDTANIKEDFSKVRKRYNSCPEHDVCFNNGTRECEYCRDNFHRKGLRNLYCTSEKEENYIKGYDS